MSCLFRKPLAAFRIVTACLVTALILCCAWTVPALAFTANVDTLDDGYVSEAGSGNWTSEHDAVYQTYVGDTLDIRSDMDLDPVLEQMNTFENTLQVSYPDGTSGITLSGTTGDLAATITIPKGVTYDASKTFMHDNDLYMITSIVDANGTAITDSSNGTITGPGQFTINMSLKTSFTTYNELREAIAGLEGCDMASGVPNDQFAHEIRVIFPGVYVNSDMTGQDVTTGMGTMVGQFSAKATLSYLGMSITHDFTIGLSSHQYEGGLDANEPAGSTKTSVTVRVNPAASVTVTKKWDHGTQAQADWPTSTTVHLLDSEGNVLSSATLSAENSWEYTFASLDPSVSYSVTEDPVSGFSSTVGEMTGNAQEGYATTVTNTYIEPTTPTTPSTPSPTATVPTTTASADVATESAGVTPQTGDGSTTSLAIMLVALSVTALGIGVARRVIVAD